MRHLFGHYSEFTSCCSSWKPWNSNYCSSLARLRNGFNLLIFINFRLIKHDLYCFAVRLKIHKQKAAWCFSSSDYSSSNTNFNIFIRQIFPLAMALFHSFNCVFWFEVWLLIHQYTLIASFITCRHQSLIARRCKASCLGKLVISQDLTCFH